MSLKVAWSLLSLLTWFRSKYQQFTGDNKFWSFLQSEERQDYHPFQSCPSQLRKTPRQTRSHARRVWSLFFYTGYCSYQGTPQPAEQPPGPWWHRASAFLGLKKKLGPRTWVKTYSPNKGHRTLPYRALRQAFGFKASIQESSSCLHKNL